MFGVVAALLAICSQATQADVVYDDIRVTLYPLNNHVIGVGETVSVYHYCTGTVIDDTQTFGLHAVLQRTSAESHVSMTTITRYSNLSTRAYGSKWRHTFTIK